MGRAGPCACLLATTPYHNDEGRGIPFIVGAGVVKGWVEPLAGALQLHRCQSCSHIENLRRLMVAYVALQLYHRQSRSLPARLRRAQNPSLATPTSPPS